MRKKYTSLGVSPACLARLRWYALAWETAAREKRFGHRKGDEKGVSLETVIMRLADEVEAHRARARQQKARNRDAKAEGATDGRDAL